MSTQDFPAPTLLPIKGSRRNTTAPDGECIKWAPAICWAMQRLDGSGPAVPTQVQGWMPEDGEDRGLVFAYVHRHTNTDRLDRSISATCSVLHTGTGLTIGQPGSIKDASARCAALLELAPDVWPHKDPVGRIDLKSEMWRRIQVLMSDKKETGHEVVTVSLGATTPGEMADLLRKLVKGVEVKVDGTKLCAIVGKHNPLGPAVSILKHLPARNVMEIFTAVPNRDEDPQLYVRWWAATDGSRPGRVFTSQGKVRLLALTEAPTA